MPFLQKQSTGSVCKAPRRCREEMDGGQAWFIQEMERQLRCHLQRRMAANQPGAESRGPASETAGHQRPEKVVPGFPVMCSLTRSRSRMREATSIFGVGMCWFCSHVGICCRHKWLSGHSRRRRDSLSRGSACLEKRQEDNV